MNLSVKSRMFIVGFILIVMSVIGIYFNRSINTDISQSLYKLSLYGCVIGGISIGIAVTAWTFKIDS